MSGPHGFLASNTNLARLQKIRNSQMRENQNTAKIFFFFFGLNLNLGAKFRTEMELLSLIKLRNTFRSHLAHRTFAVNK